jgi:hypothetical protein
VINENVESSFSKGQQESQGDPIIIKNGHANIDSDSSVKNPLEFK